MGLGKQEMDDEYHENATAKRKTMEVEKETTEELRRKNEVIV